MSAQQSAITVGTSSGKPDICSVINAIGNVDFESELSSFLYHRYGAEHFAVLRFTPERPFEIVAVSLDGTDTAHRQIGLYLDRQYWRFDPNAIEAQQMIGKHATSLMRLNISNLPDRDMRDSLYGRTKICERVLLCGGGEDYTIGLSVLRPEERGVFAESDIDSLGQNCETLLAILNKHVSLVSRRAELATALTSVDEILSYIDMAPANLPRREAEVCARLIGGVSALGIALELGISEETVNTYRKRSYQRLGIASQRELLMWYLSLWGTGHRSKRSRMPELRLQ